MFSSSFLSVTAIVTRHLYEQRLTRGCTQHFAAESKKHPEWLPGHRFSLARLWISRVKAVSWATLHDSPPSPRPLPKPVSSDANA
jgi:hypothetical protein